MARSQSSTGKSETRPKSPMPPQHQQRPGSEGQMHPKPEYEGSHYKAAGKLMGKRALITGGDSGIGRSVAVLFAREGADVAIVHLAEEIEDAQKTCDSIAQYGGHCMLISGDVRDSAFCKRAVAHAVEELGGLDILVNNAAYQNSQESIEDITDEQFERTFKTNIFGYFYMARAALPHLKAGATIINTGSITGLEGSKALLDYSATKGAIHAFTKSLAQNLVSKGIRVNCVAPGPIWTPLNAADKPAEKVAKHGASTPMKRPGQPDEVAPAYVFFASQGDSSYISGEIITVLGGQTTAG